MKLDKARVWMVELKLGQLTWPAELLTGFVEIKKCQNEGKH